MTDRMDEPRAMRAMVDALREERVPEPDWDAVEQRLSARLDDAERVARLYVAPPAPSPLRTALPMLAAAAAIVLGVGLAGSGSAPPSPAASRAVAPSSVALVRGEAGAVHGERDLAQLRVGDVVEAGDAPATFSLAGSMRWTLAPHGRVAVRAGARPPSVGDADGGHVVALERGSIRAEVAPRDPSLGLVEAFAVEVEGTRVAVHGTAFSVSRTAAGLVVDVEHGAVAIGPVGQKGETSGHLLVGPSRAAFSLDGGRTARTLPREDAVAAPAPPPVVATSTPAEPVASLDVAAPSATPAVAPPPRAGSASAPAAAPVVAHAPAAASAAEPPTPPAPTNSVEAVRAGLGRCFAQAYGGADQALGLSIGTTLTITLHEDGTVQSARFDPPLKPEFQACAAGQFGGRFADGPRSVEIALSFRR